MASDEEVRLTLRLPTPLRDRLVERAELSGRSLNAEIIFGLERYLAGKAGPIDELLIGEQNRKIELLSRAVRKLNMAIRTLPGGSEIDLFDDSE